ncbi:MAG: hypothetical protein V3T58_02375 [Candidatus Hydrothermarchaeales archaeon]
MNHARRHLPIYLGVFTISTAALILEISLIRLFSVSQWYHFAFMVVSIALFGIGASGTFLAVFPSILKRDINETLAVSSGLFSVSVILTFIVTNQIPFDPFRLSWDRMQLLYILLYYLLLAIPFFFSGLCIGSVLSKMPEKVNRLYFADLIGAGIGALLVLALFAPFSGSGVIIISALLGAFSSFLFTLNISRKSIYGSVIWTLVLAVLLYSPPGFLQINISPYKSLSVALRYPGSELLFTGWNALSRVDVVKSPYVRYAPGLSYEYSGEIPPQLGVTVDGDALSAITRHEDLEFLNYLPGSIAYQFKKNQSVLVINSGGGLEVLAALFNGAGSVTATELNPLIIDVVKERSEFSTVYEDEKVEVVIEEGRSFVRRSNERYDVIQLALTGGAPASSTGMYALTENYLYTTEAFEDYYSHLSEEGVLSVTRWLLPPPREGLRMVSLALSALEKKGVDDAEEHIAVIRSWGTITILVKKNGFSPGDIETIEDFCRIRKFDMVYFPGISAQQVNIYNRFPEPYYYQVIQRLISNRPRFYKDYLFDVSPVTDERPFFFHFFKLDKIMPLYRSMGEKWQPFVEGGYLVPVIFVQALVLSLVFIFLPVYRFKRIKKSIPEKWRILTYFMCLGIGYMFIEIALIQKFILFLGHPVYAVSTVLFALLVCSGIGSLFTGRFNVRVLKTIIPILSVLVLLYLAFLPRLFHIFLGGDFFLRHLVSLAFIAPLGFVMGMPFPLGIRLANKVDPYLVPWAWAVNGCASVLSAISAVMIALSLGFSFVLGLAGIVYLFGLLMVLKLWK